MAANRIPTWPSKNLARCREDKGEWIVCLKDKPVTKKF